MGVTDPAVFMASPAPIAMPSGVRHGVAPRNQHDLSRAALRFSDQQIEPFDKLRMTALRLPFDNPSTEFMLSAVEVLRMTLLRTGCSG